MFHHRLAAALPEQIQGCGCGRASPMICLCCPVFMCEVCRVDMHAQDDDDGPAAKRASELVTAMQTLMDIECALKTKEAHLAV